MSSSCAWRRPGGDAPACPRPTKGDVPRPAHRSPRRRALGELLPSRRCPEPSSARVPGESTPAATRRAISGAAERRGVALRAGALIRLASSSWVHWKLEQLLIRSGFLQRVELLRWGSPGGRPQEVVVLGGLDDGRRCRCRLPGGRQRRSPMMSYSRRRLGRLAERTDDDRLEDTDLADAVHELGELVLVEDRPWLTRVGPDRIERDLGIGRPGHRPQLGPGLVGAGLAPLALLVAVGACPVWRPWRLGGRRGVPASVVGGAGGRSVASVASAGSVRAGDGA